MMGSPIHDARHTRARHPRRAFTLVEAVISMLVVSLLLVASLNTVGASTTTRFKASQRATGLQLARDLIGEIMQHPYEDPTDPGGLGRESGESGGDRTDLDDVDDYDGWSGQPPQYRDGTTIPGVPGNFKRDVNVTYVEPGSPKTAAGSDKGLKRIVVTVKADDRVVVSLTAFRSSAWIDPLVGSK